MPPRLRPRKTKKAAQKRKSSSCYIVEEWEPSKKGKISHGDATPPRIPAQILARKHAQPRAPVPHNPNGKDPFTYLSYDCAGQVLSYLDIQSLVHCEGVSKGWNNFVHEWISVDGQRQHFRHARNSDMRGDRDKAVNMFRECAVPVMNLPRGRPSGARKIIADERFFTVAGDLAVWKCEDAIWWQDLRYTEEGGFRPIQKLPFHLEHRLVSLVLSADGYLLVTTERMELRDRLFNLYTGEELWSRVSDNTAFWTIGVSTSATAIAIGRERFYYTSTNHFLALDKKTGAQLYTVRFGDGANELGGGGGGLFHERMVVSHPYQAQATLSRNYTLLLNMQGKELIVSFFYGAVSQDTRRHGPSGIYPVNPAGVHVVDGADGSVLQTISPLRTRDDGQGHFGSNSILYLLPAPENDGFCVVSIDGRAFLDMRRYVLGEHGLFHAQRREIFLSKDSRHRDEQEFRCAVDPYRRLFATVWSGLVPSLGHWTEAPNEDRYMGVLGYLGLPPDQASVYYDAEFRDLELAVSDRETGQKSLMFSPYTNPNPSESDYYWLHFVDGNRLIMEIARRLERPAWAQATRPIRTEREFFVFDFARRPGGVRADEVEYERMSYVGE